MKLYGFIKEGTDSGLLLIDGDKVINGDWTAVFDDVGDVVDCKEVFPHSGFSKSPFIMDVPKEALKGTTRNDYDIIIARCVKIFRGD